ncbi:hypothetical protein B0F90DRAFT_1790357, partial [Multifurca ochricompacta]
MSIALSKLYASVPDFVASSQPLVSHQVPLFYSFARKVPNIELTVYEKENGIGGTCVGHFPGRHSLSSRISPFVRRRDQ